MTNELKDRIKNFIVSWNDTFNYSDDELRLADYDLFLETAISLLSEIIREE